MHIGEGIPHLPGKLMQERISIIEEVLPGFESGINIVALVCCLVIHDDGGISTGSDTQDYEIEADTGDCYWYLPFTAYHKLTML